jgi:hypothetical protein
MPTGKHDCPLDDAVLLLPCLLPPALPGQGARNEGSCNRVRGGEEGGQGRVRILPGAAGRLCSCPVVVHGC